MCDAVGDATRVLQQETLSLFVLSTHVLCFQGLMLMCAFYIFLDHVYVFYFINAGSIL